MTTITTQDLNNAGLDITTLSQVVNNGSGTVQNRNNDTLTVIAQLLADGEKDLLNVLQYSTKALLDADLIPGADRLAIVQADPTASNIAIYKKVGATGTGSWTKLNVFGEAGSAASLEITDFLKVRETNILNAIDILSRADVIPTLDLTAIPDEGYPFGSTFSRASAGSTFGKLGKIESISSNAIRHYYNPATGEYEGWLIETASTNKCLRSEELGNAVHLLSNCTIDANVAVAPDGTTTMDKIVENTATSVAHLYRSNVVSKPAAVETWSASCFAKAAGRDRIWFYLTSGSTSQSMRMEVNLATGEITNSTSAGSFTLISAILEAYPNGVYRLKLTGTTDSLTTIRIAIYPANDSNAITYTGDGSSGVFVWGMQIEQLASVSSYIKTEASEITRAADDFYVLSSAFSWLNVNEGTILFEGKSHASTLLSSFLLLSPPSTSERYYQIRGSSGNVLIRFYYGSANVLNADSGKLATNNFKAALSYKIGSQIGCVNGDLTTETTSNDIISDLDRLRVANIGNRTVKKVMFFPRYFNNTLLKQLTG